LMQQWPMPSAHHNRKPACLLSMIRSNRQHVSPCLNPEYYDLHAQVQGLHPDLSPLMDADETATTQVQVEDKHTHTTSMQPAALLCLCCAKLA
jgi:hypothetical protein